jgi:hypothetical protein
VPRGFGYRLLNSKAMTNQKVQNIDSEDAGDLLLKIEKSFDIKFGETELMHIKTLGELCDHILSKIQLDHSADCTTQQAFYKLRDAIGTLFRMDSKTIATDFALDIVLPRQNRKERIRDLEDYLGVDLKILRPPRWLTSTLLIVLLVSIVGLFFNWQTGLAGLCMSWVGLWFSSRMGNELDVQTVGQLAEKMARENYLKSRRNPMTVNRNEIEKILTEWFVDDLALDKSKLTREARFV